MHFRRTTILATTPAVALLALAAFGAPSAHATETMSRNPAPAVTVTAPPACADVVPTIVGTSGDDVIIGTDGNDIIFGLGGNDQIWGHGGHDMICAGRATT